MKGRRRNYTKIGKRIAALARYQRELGAVLGIAQQSVSKKLRGATATTVLDLQKLSDHHGMPLTYFFDEPWTSPELTACWERLRQRPSEAQELVVLASKLPQDDVRKLVEIVKVLTGNEDRARGQTTSSAS